MLHEELSYRPSGKEKFAPRLKYALLGSVLRPKTNRDSSKRSIAVGEISGAIGSGLISRLWQPASTATVGLGFESGGITVAIDTGMNVVKEFWPEIRHPRATRAEHARNALPLSPLHVAQMQTAPQLLLAPGAVVAVNIPEKDLIADAQ